MIYTDELLVELVGCPKRITQPPRLQMKSEGAYLRNEMILESLDGKHGFRVFMRQNRDFPENFSIGLDYVPKEEPGSFCLIRCNGVHGGHKVHPHHLHCHVHRTNAEDVNAGLRVERHIEPTQSYAAYIDGFRHFVLATNIQSSDLSQHFPNLGQGQLFIDGAST